MNTIDHSIKVRFDGITFTNNHQRGVQRYFFELLKAMGTRIQADVWVNGPLSVELPNNCTVVSPQYQKHYPAWDLVNRNYRRREHRHLQARRSGYQLFHSTFFTTSDQPGLPEVVTVHDMIVERYPQQTGIHGAEQFALKKKAIEKGSLFLCVSQSTADDLASFYPQTKERIRVTSPGVDHLRHLRTSGNVDAKVSLPLQTPKYVLYVGDRLGYKNFELIPRAMRLSSWPADVGLIVAGPAWMAHELALLENLGLSSTRIHHIGRISDAQLAHVYQQAGALICPSFLEGFGFPPLEAQMAGVPALCSDVPIFHETTGGAALFFDPYQPESLAQCVTRAMLPTIRQPLIEQGRTNVLRYTWARAAEMTLQAYREVIG